MAEINNVIAEASQDLQTIEDFVNLPAGSEVRPRLLPSVNVGTLAGTRNAIFEAGGLPATPFATKALMTASALVDGQYAQVTDDSVDSNNGLYIKTGSVFKKSMYGNTDLIKQELFSVFINNGKDHQYGDKFTLNDIKGASNTEVATTVGFKGSTTDTVVFNAMQMAVGVVGVGKTVNYRIYIGSQLNASNNITDMNTFTYSGICLSFPLSTSPDLTNGTSVVVFDDSLYLPAGTPFVIAFNAVDNAKFRVAHFSTTPVGLPDTGFLYSNVNTNWAMVSETAAALRQPAFKLFLTESTQKYSDIDIKLPPIIYATQNIESNVYLDQIMPMDSRLFDYSVTSSKNGLMSNRWRLSSGAHAAGSSSLVLSVFDKLTHKNLKDLGSTLVISNTSTTPKKVMVIGDSWIDRNDVTQTIIDNSAANGAAITLVGTRGSGLNKHEGRSGWTVARYNTNDPLNAFYNTASSGFDFGHYLSNTGQSMPDVVIIQLGINDVIHSTTDVSAKAVTDSAITLLNQYITSIKAANTSAKIAISTPPIAQSTQDGWRNNSAPAWRAKRNMYVWYSGLIEAFKDRSSTGVFIVGAGVNLDTTNNWITVVEQVNNRNTKTHEIHNDPYHTNTKGYQQIGDALYAFLMSL